MDAYPIWTVVEHSTPNPVQMRFCHSGAEATVDFKRINVLDMTMTAQNEESAAHTDRTDSSFHQGPTFAAGNFPQQFRLNFECLPIADIQRHLRICNTLSQRRYRYICIRTTQATRSNNRVSESPQNIILC